MAKVIVQLLSVCIVGLASGTANADSWMPAKPQTYEAADHSARLTVLPNATDPLTYFEQKLEELEHDGSQPGSAAAAAMATMEARDASGRWVKQWTEPLANEVAPVNVLVAPQGNRFVSFDDWYQLGYGPNAIVVYDEGGKVLNAHALDEIFPAWFVAALSHSVSSIQWREEPRLSVDGKNAVVPIRLPRLHEEETGSDPLQDLQIRLADGAVIGLEQEPWVAALTRSAVVAREICARDLALAAASNEPIAAPSAWSEPAWYFYLNELYLRTVPNSLEDYGPIVAATVLRPENADDVRPSIGWLREALTSKSDFPGDDVRMIGSPDSVWLARQILSMAPRIRRNALSGVRLIVVIDDADVRMWSVSRRLWPSLAQICRS